MAPSLVTMGKAALLGCLLALSLMISPFVSAQDVEVEVSKDFAASGNTLETDQEKIAKENDALREQIRLLRELREAQMAVGDDADDEDSEEDDRRPPGMFPI